MRFRRSEIFGEALIETGLVPENVMQHESPLVEVDPLNRETSLRDAHCWVTPNRLFFVRNHFDTPILDVSEWRLQVGGSVRTPLTLTWEQLNALPQRSVFATLECAGNGRSFLQPKVEGVQWQAGAVGHAEWAGVPLKYILDEAGLAPGVLEVVFEGADRGEEAGHEEPLCFARSLPVDKALHPDTLVALRMNGEPLEPPHGFPARLLVPGWYGVASVKWLRRIEAVTTPFEGYYQTVKYTVQRRTGRGVESQAVGAIPVKSEIVRPEADAVLGIGTNRLFGMAWAGEDAVAAVEVSTDGGQSWRRAELIGPRAPYSWTLWEFLWEVDTPGDYTILSRAVSEGGEVQPMRHDPLRGGYQINFSRPVPVQIDPSRRSRDLLGDTRSLAREMDALAQRRARMPLDVEMAFSYGAGI